MAFWLSEPVMWALPIVVQLVGIWLSRSSAISMIQEGHERGELRFLGRASKRPVDRPASRSTWNHQPAHREHTDQLRPAGLEPATDGLENRCSILLSYGRLTRQRSEIRP